MNVALISLATLPLTAIANFQWRPILPPQQIVFITVIMLALAVYAYVRHFRRHPLARLALLLMRCVGILVVAALMMGPSATPLSRVKKQDSELVVLLDCSESMATEDCRDQSRIEVALKHWLNAAMLDQLRDVASVRVAGFAEDAEQLDQEEITDPRDIIRAGESTLLVETLSDQIHRRRYGSSTVLLLSDGHDSEEYSLDTAANVAVDAGVPVNTVSFGNASVGSDLSLLAVPRQDYLLPNEAGAILVKVYQSGLPQARTRLRIDGANPREFPIEFNGQSQVELSVPIQESEAGDYSYQLTVDSVDGEVETDNNSLQVYSQVQERRIRVLLLEGQPFWDTKFLAQSLRKDERLELVQITQVAPESRETLVSRSEAEAVRVPSNDEEWAHYDVVVLGRQIQNLLNEDDATRLSDFVIEHGGHLVFARGRPYDPNANDTRGLQAALQHVEPVQWLDRELDLGEANPDVDVLGLETTWLAANKVRFETPEVLRELGGLASIDLVRRLKPATRVIMQTNGRGERNPLLVTMPAGRGNVVGLLGSGSWRWSLRAPKLPGSTPRREQANAESRNADALVGFYDTFWSNMIRWLVMGGDFQPGQQASLRVSQQAARVQDGIAINVGFKDATGIDGDWRVTLRTPAGDVRQLNLSQVPGRAPRFKTHLSLTAGTYEVQLETPDLEPPTQTRRFTMYDVNPERLDASAWPEQLRRLAERTGGVHFKIDEANRFLKSLRQASVANQVPVSPRYIWDEFWIMLLLLMWIGGEWVLRRMAGLI